MSEWFSAADKLGCAVAECNYNGSFWDKVFLFTHFAPLWMWVGSLATGVYGLHDVYLIYYFLGSTEGHLVSLGLNYVIDRKAAACSHETTDTPSRVIQFLTFFIVVFTYTPVLFARDEFTRNIAAFAIFLPIAVIGELHLGTNDEIGVFSGLGLGAVQGIGFVLLLKYVLYPRGRQLMRYINTRFGHEKSMWTYAFHYVLIYPFACEDARTTPTGVYDLIETMLFSDMPHARPAVHATPEHTIRSVEEMVERPAPDLPIPSAKPIGATGTGILTSPKHPVLAFRIAYVNGAGAEIGVFKISIASYDRVEAVWQAFVAETAPYTGAALKGIHPQPKRESPYVTRDPRSYVTFQ